jgi:hypothetical protein
MNAKKRLLSVLTATITLNILDFKFVNTYLISMLDAENKKRAAYFYVRC